MLTLYPIYQQSTINIARIFLLLSMSEPSSFPNQHIETRRLTYVDSTNRDFTLNKVFILGHLLLDNAIPCCSSEIFKCHCKASNRVMSTSTISFCSKNCVLCEELLYINHRIVKKSNHTQSVWHNEHCTLLDQLSGIYFLYTQGFMS